MSTLLETPPAAATPPAPTPAKIGSAVPSSSGEIHVAPPVEPPPPPKPGSAKARMFTELGKKAKAPFGQATPPAEPPTPPAVSPKTPPAPKTPETPVPGEDDDEAGEETPPPAEPQTPAKGEAQPAEGKKKVNPWKLLDEHKAARAKVEQELAETKKLIGNESERKQQVAEYEQMKARAKELEDHIRFVDYSKSAEFQEKYQKPYEQAWSKAMSDLKDITVAETDAGPERPFSPQDMLELVNMSLPKARELANQLFGDFADDVMAQRKEIRSLFDAQAKAMDEARTTGAERIKKQTEEQQARMSEIQGNTAKAWTKARETVAKDEKYGRFFTPVDGDEQGNQRLAKGFALVEKAFSENPLDPKLTAEQRESVVKRHAAVYNRAAAFGRLVWQNNQKDTRIAELESELKQFKETTPGTGGSLVPSAPAAGGSAMERMREELRKRAKPA